MNSENTKPIVVLVHGLAAHRWLMLPLAWHLNRNEFETHLFGYRSWFGSIESHAKRLTELLKEISKSNPSSEIHVVTQSMGSIVTRYALIQSQLPQVNRVVMLAPPNQGSPAARVVSLLFPFSKTVKQIGTGRSGMVATMAEPTGFEIGVIEGKFDRAVPPGSGSLDCQSDHLTLVSGHNGLLVRPVALKSVAQFLKTGAFTECESHSQKNADRQSA